MRDHEIFKKPFSIDVTETSPVSTPKPWRKTMTAKSVQVLSLTDTAKQTGMPGWCVYESSLHHSPEIEVMCGGINDKTPVAASIWRQGNLLHFGFQPDPGQLNEVGRKLLLNSIAYIAKFSEDRPIATTPSIWLGEKVMPERARLKSYNHPSLPKATVARDAWLAKHRGVLVPDAKNTLVPDQGLLKLGVGSADPAFFTTCIAAIGGRLDADARRALGRYVPDGPGAKATADSWRAYWKQDGPFLFFSEASGYRWYLDPLAKRRKTPTAELRGPARARPKESK